MYLYQPLEILLEHGLNVGDVSLFDAVLSEKKLVLHTYLALMHHY